MDARNIPFESEFDVIGAFDVLEHINEDTEVLAQIYTALKAEGLMLISVPQHPWLWSSLDEYACHVRRYTALDIQQKIEAAGIPSDQKYIICNHSSPRYDDFQIFSEKGN